MDLLLYIWLKTFELLSIQLNSSLHSFLKTVVLFFYYSPASRISQEWQPHYQPKMCSSILLLCSDKGTARRVTQVHTERCRKQHFSHWSIGLHVNECQWAMVESQSCYMQNFSGIQGEKRSFLCKPALTFSKEKRACNIRQNWCIGLYNKPYSLVARSHDYMVKMNFIFKTF